MKELLQRFVPKNWWNQIEFCLDTGQVTKDYFSLDMPRKNYLIIKGNNKVSLASGLYYYLTNYCHYHVTWDQSEALEMEIMPQIPEGKVEKASPYSLRYAYNYCTFNYTMNWWNKDRWLEEIDWLALHGYNMPLGAVGHEKVWQRICEKLGIDENGLKEFLTGPGFYAWNYMGNVDNIGGPTPDSWIEGQYDLQKSILEKQRSYDMKPVLLGFYGHVPRALKKLYPEANIIQLKSWYDAEGVYFLDPLDPLFDRVAQLFYETQEELYGSCQYYSMDLFHEGSAPDESDEYLISRAKAVNAAMKKYDSKGKWVMQAWTYREKVAQAIPHEDMMILDLYADEKPIWSKSDGFKGKDFIWCMLHNFGGRPGLFGHLENIVNEPIKLLKSSYEAQLKGIGMAPEAIEENAIFYELLTTMMWEETKIDMETWLKNFITCRYGHYKGSSYKAYTRLLETAYSGVNPNGGTDSVICARPSTNVTKVSNGSLISYYEEEDLLPIIEELLKEKEIFGERDAYRYDLVNLCREYLSLKANHVYWNMMEAYRDKDKACVQKWWKRFREMMTDMEALLASNSKFLLGNWVEEARSWGATDKEKALFELNAKMQVSRWWPDVNFLDYAHKQWQGFLGSYYLPRWERFHELLIKSLEGEILLTNDFVKREMIQIEEDFYLGDEKFTTKTTGNSIEIVSSLVMKYGQLDWS